MLSRENERLRQEKLALTEALKNAGANADSRKRQLVKGNPSGNGLPECDLKMMAETAAKGMAELTELLRTDEPFWMRCPMDPERFTIHREIYEKRFSKANHLKISSSRFESSKDSTEVQMNATDLVKLFMHPVHNLYI